MKNDYSFALAQMADVSEVIELYHSLIGTPGCAWNLDYPDMETVESDIESGSLYILKYYDKIIAAAALGISDELEKINWSIKNPCDLARFGVQASMQNRGIGTLLLKNVMNAAKERGFDGIRMLVSKKNLSALALYNKNGFIKCGEIVMYGIDFYCYKIAL
ncbi:MAG: GNAT family N-acetyltransferase [Oscillospiraceae bacterium]|jgi:ribosomal protein S18 acetylase RimI-like enzyme|nr:GNAT family N-acetyltransferase [Oscillospiraceae bacterium]